MKLTAKVLFAQLIAITLALTLTGWLIDWRAGIAYLGYFTQTQASQLLILADQAARQYATTGDWQAVQDWLDQIAPGQMGRQMGAHMGHDDGGRNARENGMGNMGARTADALFLVVDTQSGRQLATSSQVTWQTDDSLRIPDAVLAAGAPIVVDGEEVARLVSLRAPGEIGRAEAALLTEVQNAILLSAVVSGLIALVIGALLVASMLHPLRAVERTVVAVAGGDLGARVGVRGQDEIAKLGDAVNQMAATLEAQETLRQRLVSDVAHELRTPLSVIQGNLQAILDGVYPLNREEIQTVIDETQLLSRLVTDLHELAQAEAGRLLLHRQQLSVAAILSHLTDLYTPLAAQQDVALTVESPAEPLEVNADPDRLQQIFHNLLGNALRHTPAGENIHLAVRAEAAPQRDAAMVRFILQDTGSGIAATDLPHVFERFYRSATNRARPADHATGAGLGLAIVKAFVVAHGGQIGVMPTTPPLATHGATFWFTLPSHAPR